MLSKEAKIVLKGSKLNLNDDDSKYIIENLDGDIDFSKFLYYCVHHRVGPMIWKNIQKLKLTYKLENSVRRAIRNIHNAIKANNNLIYTEIRDVNENFYKAGIKAIPLKGAVLAQMVYKDIALREFGDVDYLIKIEDISKVTKALLDMGYVQGSYDFNKGEIIPASKYEKMFRRMNTHELVEFIKPREDDSGLVYMIDINHSIFWKGDNKNRDRFKINNEDIFNDATLVDINGSKTYCMSPEYQLVQLCAHLYSEAVYFCWEKEWVWNKSEVCLYRFCDIHELILTFDINWDKLKLILQNNNLSEPVYYCLASVNKLFGNCVSENFLNELNVDERILDRFYDKDGNELYWNLSLYDRLFSIEEKYNEVLRMGIL